MTRTWIERLWPHLAAAQPVAPASEAPLARAQALCAALLSERGEVSGTALARDLLRTTFAFTDADEDEFLRFLARGFAPDPAQLRDAAEAYLLAPSSETAHQLALVSEPPRQELLRRINMATGGTALLVAMRADVLQRLDREPELRPLADDLQHLLSSWFNRGFLELRRIDWQTPAHLLEKLIRYEAVHEIQGWDDLRRRLAPDRRCFAFFHPALRDEPLIFVEVALLRDVPEAIAPILAPQSVYPPAADAQVAVFYSISNCQPGLRGISFGNLLIKQVVEELQAELPGLRTFVTLSPVPSLRRHFDKSLAAGVSPFTAEEEAQLLSATGAASVKDALAGELDERCREPLLRATARALTDANDGRGPRDPVARFHLGNGARLERIDWGGNGSRRGVRESFGIMVNYLYEPAELEANHEVFARTGLVARSAAVRALLGTAEAALSNAS